MSKVWVIDKNVQNKWIHWNIVEIQSSNDEVKMRALVMYGKSPQWADENEFEQLHFFLIGVCLSSLKWLISYYVILD